MNFFFAQMISSHSSSLAASPATTKTLLRKKNGVMMRTWLEKGFIGEQFNPGHTNQSWTLNQILNRYWCKNGALKKSAFAENNLLKTSHNVIHKYCIKEVNLSRHTH